MLRRNVLPPSSRSKKQASNLQDVGTKQAEVCLLPEVGGNTFLRNVEEHLPDYMVSHPGTLQTDHWNNLKPNRSSVFTARQELNLPSLSSSFRSLIKVITYGQTTVTPRTSEQGQQGQEKNNRRNANTAARNTRHIFTGWTTPNDGPILIFNFDV
jgi:hypothetical protein